MISLKNYAARYFRRLVKELVIFLPAVVLVLVVFNLLQQPTLFERTRNQASRSPRDLASKLILGRLLYQNNNLTSAEFELTKIVDSKKNDPKSKRAAEDLLFQIYKEKNAPLVLHQKITSWQDKNFSFPNSRDINLKLAVLNWQLYRVFEANKILTTATALDPNNKNTLKFKNALK